jgi:hypothetical protein
VLFRSLGAGVQALGEHEDACLRQWPLEKAEADGTLAWVASTFDATENAIRDTLQARGPRVVTFAPILKHGLVPLAGIVQELLAAGRRAFGSHVEIEFALDIVPGASPQPVFYLLQIRPMVTGREGGQVETTRVDPATVWCESNEAMGSGLFTDLHDLIYLDPDRFDPARTTEMATEIGDLNRRIAAAGRSCILLGFGRFGTSDPWLGVPVEWHQMSAARVVIEADLPRFRIDPSQGSHFFHNLISLQMGYLHVGIGEGRGRIDWEWLKSRPAELELRYARHLRFASPLTVRIDAHVRRGVVQKPAPE